ncbi:MAG: zinc ribbon domain-containing protein [Candidatus Marinimicrobia bacterium]|nr:zinc ribbon domain-containing protein [Candidatus Neomarinimicrobiota bacterium]
MPVFDYECKNCGKVFEELVMSSSTPDSDIECPGCGEHNSIRRMSAPSIGGGSSSFSSAAGCGSSGFS